MKRNLEGKLTQLCEQVINKILSDINYIRTVGEKLRAIVMPAFVRAFQFDFGTIPLHSMTENDCTNYKI
jgi:hypothetical protein